MGYSLLSKHILHFSNFSFAHGVPTAWNANWPDSVPSSIMLSFIVTILESNWPKSMENLKIIPPLDCAQLILAEFFHVFGDWLNVEWSWTTLTGTAGLSSKCSLILQRASLDLMTVAEFWKTGSTWDFLTPGLGNSLSFLPLQISRPAQIQGMEK